MPSKHIARRWAKYQQASDYCGYSVRHLQNLVADGLIRSSMTRRPGATRGVRIIDLRSLDLYIESGVGERCELAMNKKREGGRR